MHPEACEGDGRGQWKGQPAAVATQGMGDGTGHSSLCGSQRIHLGSALCWPPAMSSQWKEGKEVPASSSSSCPCFMKEHLPVSAAGAGHRLDIPGRNLLWFPFLGKSNECSGHLGPSLLIWRSPGTGAWVSSFRLIVD